MRCPLSIKRRGASLAALFIVIFSLCSCSPAPARENDKLWVVTDLGQNNAYAGSQYSDGQEGGQIDLEFIIDFFGGLPGDKEVELEVLPVEEEELKARVSRLKVEIASGGGPDVFILSSDMPMADSAQPRLFPVPEKAVQEGKFFLPLDDYIKSTKHMEWDQLNQSVMAVGRSEHGQMLLPMFHSINLGIAYEDIPSPGDIPANWDSAVESQPPIQEAYSEALRNGCFRSMVLAQCADYHGEELLITEEELAKRVREALSLNQDQESGAPSEWLFTPLVVDGLWESTQGSESQETVFPLRNVEGTVTSRVDSYIAVNRNTPYPKEAFAPVDMLMSKEFLTLEPFWDEQRMASVSGIYLFSELPVWGGLPVYDCLLEEGGDAEIDAPVQKSYTTMEMMLAES